MSIPADEDGFGREDIASLTNVSRETLDRIEIVLAALIEWSERMNLVSASQRDVLWRRHVWDSLALLPHLEHGSDIVDLGSGSGFPALVLGCWQAAEGGGSITMVESIAKKCAFLREAASRAGLMFHVKHSRIEAVDPPPKAENTRRIVTARAVSSLDALLGYARPWLAEGDFALFHKGARPEEELTAARQGWTFACEAMPNRASPDGVILRIADIRPKPGNALDDQKTKNLRRR